MEIKVRIWKNRKCAKTKAFIILLSVFCIHTIKIWKFTTNNNNKKNSCVQESRASLKIKRAQMMMMVWVTKHQFFLSKRNQIVRRSTKTFGVSLNFLFFLFLIQFAFEILKRKIYTIQYTFIYTYYIAKYKYNSILMEEYSYI